MSFPIKNQLVLAALLLPLPVVAIPMEDLIKQADNLPEGFRDHLFNAPLLARVELDGRPLGDAMILLSDSGSVQLMHFSETDDSKLSPGDRTKWAGILNKPFPLGKCTQSCPSGLQNLQYNLVNATLYITTDAATERKEAVRHVELPEEGSTGLIMRNQMNLVGGELQPWSGYQSLQLESSIGNWTAQASSQLSRSDMEESETQARINSLFVQRELPGHAVRGGLFTPDNQGIIRQPSMPGRSASQTLVGFMAGSSDTLLESQSQASLYPIYVSANRDSVAEIYRDGVLINSQPVAVGMQQLDTTVLPGGIYGVEVRVLEDGREVSRNEETIYKPNHWQNPDRRWNYNLYGGVEKELGNNKYNEKQGDAALGASANYLLTPRLVVGAAAQRNGSGSQAGTSVDVQSSSNTRFYGSAGVSDTWGSRYDSQFSWQLLPQTSLLLNHSQSWYQPDDNSCLLAGCRTERQKNYGATLNHRLDNGDSLSLRGSRNNSQAGTGLDASYRTRFKIKDSPVSLTVNAFDRPYGMYQGQRNRGANLNLSFSFGESQRSASASFGSRNDNQGGRDLYATAGVTQNFESGAIKRVNLGITGDKYGAGGSAYADFDGRYASGSLYAQQSTLNQKLSGGLNMSNTLAVGGGKLSVSHSSASWASHTGMIIDVDSDDPEVKLAAWDGSGNRSLLHSGRNFIPVSAWKSGQVQVDFEGRDGPAMKIWPTELPYHLNKGGVAHGKVRVMKTVTVVGRLVDKAGKPVSGAKLVNHAGHGISEHDGFFVTDMHEHTPELTIHHRDEKQCTVTLNPARMKRENNTLMVGDVSCKLATKS